MEFDTPVGSPEEDSKGTDVPIVFADVTEFLRKTAAGMVTGQMIHGESFSLHEAMSALELMDPKMDSGMNSSKPLSAETLLQEVPPLTVPQMLAVMDELVACEVSWINGNSIGHTVFTCLYLHKPQLIASPILKVYVDMLLKTVSLMRQAIIDADVFEDEDFVSGKYNFSLNENMSKEDCFAQLHVVCERLEAQILQASGKGKSGEAIPPLQDDPSLEVELCSALLHRLRFSKAWYNIHSQLASPKPTLATLKPCHKLISTALQHLERTTSTFHLSDPSEAPASTTTTATSAADEHKPKTSATTPITPGFSMEVTKNLVSSGPPRDVRIVTRTEGYGALKTFLNQFNHLLELPACTTLEDIQLFVRIFSLSNPNVLLRSHLLILLQTEQDFLGQGPLARILKESCHRLSASTIPHTGSEEFEVFVGRVAKPVSQMFRTLCSNRTRQRRKIPKLMGDWGILQADAMVLDQKAERDASLAHTNPCRHAFFSWVFDQTVQLLTHHTLLGFELELYMPREYPVTLWHLEHLFDLRLQNLNLAYRPIEKKEKPPKKVSKKINAPPPAAPAHPRTAQFLAILGHLYLTRGLLQALFVFARLGRPLPPLNPEHRKNWFANRFVLLDMVNQPPMSLEMYDQAVDYYMNRITTASVYKMAIESFSQSVQHFTKAITHELPPGAAQIAVLEQLKEVASGNSAELARHIKGLAQPNSLRNHRISFNFTLSKHFPLISVQPAASVQQ